MTATPNPLTETKTMTTTKLNQPAATMLVLVTPANPKSYTPATTMAFGDFMTRFGATKQSPSLCKEPEATEVANSSYLLQGLATGRVMGMTLALEGGKTERVDVCVPATVKFRETLLQLTSKMSWHAASIRTCPDRSTATHLSGPFSQQTQAVTLGAAHALLQALYHAGLDGVTDWLALEEAMYQTMTALAMRDTGSIATSMAIDPALAWRQVEAVVYRMAVPPVMQLAREYIAQHTA